MDNQNPEVTSPPLENPVQPAVSTQSTITPPPPKSGLSNKLILIVIILIILLGAGGTYLALQATTSPKPNSSSSKETKNWKTYISNDSLFKLSYPSNWGTSDSVQNTFYANHKEVMQVIVFDVDVTSEYFVQSSKRSPLCGTFKGGANQGAPPPEFKEEKTITFGTQVFYWRKKCDDQVWISIPNDEKNKVVRISTLDIIDEDILNQILSTFKFIQ